jgi:isocitrate/isopropylmalate dehydrogenase
MMLRYLGEPEAAARIDRAIDHVLGASEVRTRDLGGTASTAEYTDALIAELA